MQRFDPDLAVYAVRFSAFLGKKGMGEEWRGLAGKWKHGYGGRKEHNVLCMWH